MRRIPFIQVGVGNRGLDILDMLLAQHAQRFEPVGFVDVVPQFLDGLHARPALQAIPTFATLDRALAKVPQAQAVFVVTPARFHAPLIEEAIEGGKHVWVEKPLCYDYAEAVALADLARKHKRVVVVGNQYQFFPLERTLQRLIRSGDYGRPFHVSYIHHRHRPAMRAFTGEYPALWEQGVHSLDSILALLDTPALASVYALGLKPHHSAYRSDTITNVLTQFADGTQAHLLVTFDSHRTDWLIRVECTHAALALEPQHGTSVQVIAGGDVVEEIGADEEADPALADPLAAFHTEITTGHTTPTSIDLNLRTIQWIDAAVRSLRSGMVVRL
jgi:predicted dehydrogenase